MTPSLQQMQDSIDAVLRRRVEFHRQCYHNAPTPERRKYHEQEMARLNAQFEGKREYEPR